MENYYQIKTIKISLKVKEPVFDYARDPESVVAVVQKIYQDLDADQEHFMVLALDKGNAIKGYKIVHSGGIDHTLIDPRIIYRYALIFGATGIIMVHNHPSRKTAPSPEDSIITSKLKEISQIIDIKLTDHLIIGNGQYFSFRGMGLL